jgi:hypothetical protein
MLEILVGQRREDIRIHIVGFEGRSVLWEPDRFEPLPYGLRGPSRVLQDYDTFTTSLPRFEPSNILFNAIGALRNPCTTLS